jgi:hypothetical protein
MTEKMLNITSHEENENQTTRRYDFTVTKMAKI